MDNISLEKMGLAQFYKETINSFKLSPNYGWSLNLYDELSYGNGVQGTFVKHIDFDVKAWEDIP